MTKVLNLMEGDWYDADGNRVLQIGGGYINSCRVLAAYDFAGSSSHGAGRFDILENTGSRAVLEHSGLNCENTPYEFAQAYQMKHVPQVCYDDSNVFTGCHAIGGEEDLSFGNRMEYVMLSKYWN